MLRPAGAHVRLMCRCLYCPHLCRTACIALLHCQVWYRFVMQLGITSLNGTTSAQHMADDLAVLHWAAPLSSDEMRSVGALIGEPL